MFDFNTAEQRCQADGSSLVLPCNPEENKVIAETLRAKNIEKSWIGAGISPSYWHGANGDHAFRISFVTLDNLVNKYTAFP